VHCYGSSKIYEPCYTIVWKLELISDTHMSGPLLKEWFHHIG